MLARYGRTFIPGTLTLKTAFWKLQAFGIRLHTDRTEGSSKHRQAFATNAVRCTDWNRCSWKNCSASARIDAIFADAPMTASLQILHSLRWKVFVDAKIYAAYFFSLMEGIRPGDCDRALEPCHLI